MQASIPSEFIHPSHSPDPNDDPVVFIEQFSPRKTLSLADSFSRRFPQFSDLVDATGGDFALILEGLKQEKANEEIRKEQQKIQEDNEARKKITAFEEYWDSKKVGFRPHIC